MAKSRRFSLLIAVLFIITTLIIQYNFFTSIKQEVSKYQQRDNSILQNYSAEIVEKLKNAESMEKWQSIIDDYPDLVVVVEDTNGVDIALTTGKDFSVLDHKVQQPFAYNGDAYLVKISAYFLRTYLTDSEYFGRLVIVVIIIAIAFLIALVFFVYTIMLRPVYKLYDSIERYEKGESVKRMPGRSETAQLQNRFVDMIDTIENQQQNQRRIIASISHDIKTPLTSIMGYAELLKKSNISDARRERYIGTVYQKAEDIKALIEDFDEYLSYNMEGNLKKVKMTVDVMMSKLTESYDDELERLNVKLIYQAKENNDVVEVDIQKMRRVFGNVISNSLKHFDGDEKIIKIDCESKDDFVEIIISDNGTGVEPEKMEMVFEPLYTSDEGRKVAGLGLAICREIVGAHGGEIHARNSEYGGLAIVIKLKKIN